MPVASHGDIDVIPNPVAKGDMPPPPEFGNVPRDIRKIKVNGQVQADHFAQAYGDIAVAGEVKKNADGEEGQKQAGGSKGQIRPFLEEVNHHGGVVRDDQFLEKSQQDLEEPQQGLLHLRSLQPVLKLGEKGLVALDGPRNDGGEKEAENAELEGILHRFTPVVNVGQVMDEFEREEGNAQGQGGLIGMGLKPLPQPSSQEVAQGRNQEVLVLVSQQSQNGNQQGAKENTPPLPRRTPFFRDPEGEKISQNRHHKNGLYSCGTGEVVLENHAADEREDQANLGCRHQPQQGIKNDEKEKKPAGVKNQKVFPCSSKIDINELGSRQVS